MTKVKRKQDQIILKPKEKYRIKNWSSYNKSLVARGSITLWLSDEVISSWYHGEKRRPGGKMVYSASCISCLLSIKSLFSLGFRQTEGFGRSLLKLMDLDILMPSYSQICRRQGTLQVNIKRSDREKISNIGKEGVHIVVDSTGLKVYGEGEWKVRRYGVSKRRTWRKLHLVVDESNNDLLAVELTENSVDDAQMVEPLLEQIDCVVDKFGADGAYDKVKVYDLLEERQIEPIIPPREGAIVWTDNEGNDLDHPRNKAVLGIEKSGLAQWKRDVGYHRRSKAEVAMFRFKQIFGSEIYARKLVNQKTEVKIKCAIINRFNDLGGPVSVKVA